MNLFVRDIEPVVMRTLDELARKKRVSRSEYIRQVLRSVAVLEEMQNEQNRYDRLVQATLHALTENTEMLQQVALLLNTAQP